MQRRRPRPRQRRSKKPGEGNVINSRGGSYAWTQIVADVIKHEPVCRLQLPGCTIRSQTADHIIPKCFRPDLATVRSNLRGSCIRCNLRRGNKPLEQVRAELLAKQRPRRAPALAFFQVRTNDD